MILSVNFYTYQQINKHYINTHTYIHTYIHTHTYIQTYISINTNNKTSTNIIQIKLLGRKLSYSKGNTPNY